MGGEETRKSLWEVLRSLPDPRGRQGRRYPMATLLGLLFIAALAGETTLRGMVQWIQARVRRWMARYPELDLWDVPSYNAFYYLLRKLDPDRVAWALERWFHYLEPQDRRVVWTAEGKVLRGSKRRGAKAYQVVDLLVQGAKEVRALGWVPEGQGESSVLVEMLWRLPVDGKLVTLDAGNMNRPVTQVIVEKGGLM